MNFIRWQYRRKRKETYLKVVMLEMNKIYCSFLLIYISFKDTGSMRVKRRNFSRWVTHERMKMIPWMHLKFSSSYLWKVLTNTLTIIPRRRVIGFCSAILSFSRWLERDFYLWNHMQTTAFSEKSCKWFRLTSATLSSII